MALLCASGCNPPVVVGGDVAGDASVAIDRVDAAMRALDRTIPREDIPATAAYPLPDAPPDAGEVVDGTYLFPPFAPTVDTVLESGVHRFGTMTVPAGVTVSTQGRGVLVIEVDGPHDVEGSLDVSGGSGGPSGRGGNTGNRGSGPAGGTGGDGASPMGLFGTSPLGSGRNGGGAGAYTSGCTACGPCFGSHGSGGGGFVGGRGGVSGEYMPSMGCCNGGGSEKISTRIDGISGPGYEATPPRPLPPPDVTSEGLWCQTVPEDGHGGEIGATAAGDLSMSLTFRTGSGGGGGGARAPIGSGGGGGGGGGALWLRSWTRITLRPGARILADGGDGGSGDGVGGGGSGGALWIGAPDVTIAAGATISAHGGNDGGASAGGLGRIVIATDPAHCSLLGTFNPPLGAGCALSTPPGVPAQTYVARFVR